MLTPGATLGFLTSKYDFSVLLKINCARCEIQVCEGRMIKGCMSPSRSVKKQYNQYMNRYQLTTVNCLHSYILLLHLLVGIPPQSKLQTPADTLSGKAVEQSLQEINLECDIKPGIMTGSMQGYGRCNLCNESFDSAAETRAHHVWEGTHRIRYYKHLQKYYPGKKKTQLYPLQYHSGKHQQSSW